MIIHKLYLNTFMDMCNGETLSYEINQKPSAQNIMKAYSHRLKEERIFQNMSRKGNCYDNSLMENFFALLKKEIIMVLFITVMRI